MGDSADARQWRVVGVRGRTRIAGRRGLFRRGDAVERAFAAGCGGRADLLVPVAVGRPADWRPRRHGRAAGALRTGWQRPRVLGLLLLGFVPYAVFHLLFHEVVTVRYALPLLVPVAWLRGGCAGMAGADGLACWCVPCSHCCRSRPASRRPLHMRAKAAPRSGRSREVGELGDAGSRAPWPTSTDAAIGMHAVRRRAAQWEGQRCPDACSTHRMDASGSRWSQEWRAHPDASVAFVADPRRTDLALIDPAARRLRGTYRWKFTEPPFVGGARPGNSDLYLMSPPRWMLDRGWALGAEVAGVTARDRLGPHRRRAWRGCGRTRAKSC